MSDCSPSACIVITVEIALPDLPEEEQDVIADDLTNEFKLDRLRAIISRWARCYAGVPCYIVLEAD